MKYCIIQTDFNNNNKSLVEYVNSKDQYISFVLRESSKKIKNVKIIEENTSLIDFEKDVQLFENGYYLLHCNNESHLIQKYNELSKGWIYNSDMIFTKKILKWELIENDLCNEKNILSIPKIDIKKLELDGVTLLCGSCDTIKEQLKEHFVELDKVFINFNRIIYENRSSKYGTKFTENHIDEILYAQRMLYSGKKVNNVNKVIMFDNFCNINKCMMNKKIRNSFMELLCNSRSYNIATIIHTNESMGNSKYYILDRAKYIFIDPEITFYKIECKRYYDSICNMFKGTKLKGLNIFETFDSFNNNMKYLNDNDKYLFIDKWNEQIYVNSKI